MEAANYKNICTGTFNALFLSLGVVFKTAEAESGEGWTTPEVKHSRVVKEQST